MSSQVSTEVEVSIGTLPSQSGFQLSLDFGSGLTHQNAINSRLAGRIGTDPSHFKLYLSFQANSSDAAEKLAAHLKTSYEHALGNESSPIGEVLRKLKPDPDEPAIASFEFSHHGNHAVVSVTGSQHEEQAKMFYEMAKDQAGPIFATGNLVHFEIDTGKNLGEILSPGNGSSLLDSVLVKFVLTADPQALVHGHQLADGLGPQRNRFKRLLALASLYNGASLKLKFKTGSELPDNAKEMVNGVSSMIPPLDQVLPPQVLEFLNGVVEHSGHDLYVNLITEDIALEVHVSAKGASQILQRN